MQAHLVGGLGRAGERHHVQRLQRIQQARRAATDDRQGAGREDASVDHVLHHALGQPGGGGAGLDDHRHAREQRGRRFFPQAPRRKVKRIDQERHAACGHQHMLRLEQRVFAQAHHVGVYQMVALAQRFAEFGVSAQGKDAAVNVHRRVVLHRAAVGGGDLVIGVAVGLQHLDGGAQQGGTLAVVQGAQGSAAGVAGKGKASGQV